MRIEDIDKNFASESLDGVELRFVDAFQAPMALTGFPFWEQDRSYCRLPLASLAEQNAGVRGLAWHCSGAQLRFRTDSPALALRVELRSANYMSHMPPSGHSGFDMYVGAGSDKRFVKTAMPPNGQSSYCALLAKDHRGGMRELTLNWPLYNGVKRLEIGFSPQAQLLAPTPFTISKPILFYGSSITQGGCASRPGMSYTQQLGRRFDAPVINFGFSGSARGELSLAAIIAGLDLSALVLDYDHNAPDVEHLAATHQPFFRHIREQQPDLPIVLVTRPDVDLSPTTSAQRYAIVRRTYDDALAAGDGRLYFVDGVTLFGESDRDACTVDGCHPNDLGFLRMADGIAPALRVALGWQSSAVRRVE
jgi:lysophospholipase L1-like esterase